MLPAPPGGLGPAPQPILPVRQLMLPAAGRAWPGAQPILPVRQLMLPAPPGGLSWCQPACFATLSLARLAASGSPR